MLCMLCGLYTKFPRVRGELHPGITKTQTSTFSRSPLVIQDTMPLTTPPPDNPRVALLDVTEEPVNAVVSKRFHAYSLGLGLTVGAFMQLSTLGANFLVLSALNEDFVKHNSASLIVLPFLTIVVAKMIMTLIVVGFMRITIVSCCLNTSVAEEREQRRKK